MKTYLLIYGRPPFLQNCRTEERPQTSSRVARGGRREKIIALLKRIPYVQAIEYLLTLDYYINRMIIYTAKEGF